MAIDMTEFVLEIEDTFRLKIRDEDRETLDTVGALCQYVVCHSSQTD